MNNKNSESEFVSTTRLIPLMLECDTSGIETKRLAKLIVKQDLKPAGIGQCRARADIALDGGWMLVTVRVTPDDTVVSQPAYMVELAIRDALDEYRRHVWQEDEQ